MVTAAEENEDPKKIRNKPLEYVFQPSRDHFPAKPYYEDGDPSMYSDENMTKRDALKDSPSIRTAIMDFVGHHFMLQGGSNKLCTKDEYIRSFMKVGSVLRPGIDTDELAKMLREDFESNTQPRKRRKKKAEDDEDQEAAAEPEEQEANEPPKNPDALTEDQLHDALFELADTWCPSIEEDEYVEFFEILHQKMLYSNQQDSSAYDVLN